MLRQAQHGRLDVIVGSRHLAHVLPPLRGGVKAMDQRGVAVVLLAVPTEHVKLPLHDGAPGPHVRHRQGRHGRPRVRRQAVHLARQLIHDSHPLVRADSTGHVQALTQRLHAVVRSRSRHGCHVGASRLRVVHEQRGETVVVAALPPRDKDLASQNFCYVSTQRPIQGLREAERRNRKITEKLRIEKMFCQKISSAQSFWLPVFTSLLVI